MAAAVPSTLALASIGDGANIVASDHRNNYAACQVGVNGLIAMFSTLTAKGDILVATAAGTVDRLPVGANGTAIVADSTQALGVKYAAAGALTYRKTTAKPVNTTVSPTDLLNAEITIAAGAMGTTGLTRLSAFGDWKNNSGGAAAPPRFQLVLGATTIFDTGTSGTCTNAATRYGWRLAVEILNAGSASAQVANFLLTLSGSFVGNVNNAFTTGAGVYLCNTPSALANALGEAYGTAAENTATAKALVLNVINGSANAAYETNLAGALVEVI